MRLVPFTWPFPFLVRLSRFTANTPNPDPLHAQGRVYLFRGQGIIFSRGFGRMCNELRRAGWWAQDLRCVGDLWLLRHLRAEHEARRLQGPLVLVGHSCGGRAALDVARRLQPLRVAVSLIVCVDVAWPYAVSANVAKATHLFRSRRRLYPAGPLSRAAGSEAIFENTDLDAPSAPLQERGLHHFNITSRPAVQAWILNRISEIGPQSCLA